MENFEDVCVVIGIQHIKSKKDGQENQYTIFKVLKEFDEYAINNGAVGQDVESIFMNGCITDIKINDNVVPIYGKNFNGQAYVKKLQVVE